MRFRAWLTQHLGAPATAKPAARPEDWLQGRADLLIAGMGGQVPAVVQLNVLPTPIWAGWPISAATAGSDRSAGHGEQRWPASPAISPASRVRSVAEVAAPGSSQFWAPSGGWMIRQRSTPRRGSRKSPVMGCGGLGGRMGGYGRRCSFAVDRLR
jgi:hypothetical protein